MEIQQGNSNMQIFFILLGEKNTKYALVIIEFISFMTVLLDMNLFINRNRRKQQHCKVCNSCAGEFEEPSVSVFGSLALGSACRAFGQGSGATAQWLWGWHPWPGSSGVALRDLPPVPVLCASRAEHAHPHTSCEHTSGQESHQHQAGLRGKGSSVAFSARWPLFSRVSPLQVFLVELKRCCSIRCWS